MAEPTGSNWEARRLGFAPSPTLLPPSTKHQGHPFCGAICFSSLQPNAGREVPTQPGRPLPLLPLQGLGFLTQG